MAWRISAWALRAVALLAVALSAYVFVTPKGDDAWPKVEARVLSIHFVGVVSPSSGTRGQPTGPSVLSRHRVEYEYTVEGVRYRGSDVASEAPRESVHVYVDPRNPAVSVIEPGVDMFLVFGSLVIAGVAYAFSRMFRSAGG